MIDFLLGILGRILELILSFIAPVMILTGEIVLAILSLGYHRPRFNKDTYKEYTSEFPVKSLSFWVGILFWVCIGLYLDFDLGGD
ncbi:MAG: hypothetical protein WBO24_06315 [Nitrospirales bacterium]